jgi:hypothetical protein
VSESESSTAIDVGFSIDGIETVPATKPGEFAVELGKSSGLGDQTVPLRSADHQRLRGKFSGIFAQSGHEHQASYSDVNAVNSTLFSLSRIISAMKWSDDA